jgi:GntR family transcriptional repressor for pyruvate dehydrogenase complex
MEAGPKLKIRRKRLSEELTVQLRKYIIDQGLKPGDPLLTEDEMVEKFGVSHTVVREATKALDFLGILNVAPRRGLTLNNFDFEAISEYFGFHFALSDYPPEKLLGSRAVIEMGTMPYTMAAMKENPAIYEQLRDLAAKNPDADRFNDSWIEYDIAFHRGLVEASGLSPLVSFCDLLQAFFHKFRTKLFEIGDARGGLHQHHQIIDFLRDGKLDAANAIMRSHLSTYELVEK